MWQTQVLIVDTGSRFTAWACHPCKNCGKGSSSSGSSSTTKNQRTSTKTKGNDSTFHLTQFFQTKLYDPALSRTMQTVPCGRCQWASRLQSCDQSSNNQCIVQQKYTEGSSWKAYEANDIVAIDLEPMDNEEDETEAAEELPLEESMEWLLPFTFGCQTSVTGLFRKQYADGILGLERSQHSLVHHMQQEGLLPYNAFSLCVGRQGTGYMGLGGGLTNRHLEPMKFTPIFSSDESTSRSADGSSMYSVMVDQLWLDHICLVGCITNTSHPHSSAYQHDKRLLEAFQEGKGTILDSGTTDTYLPKALAPDFVKAWYALTGRKLETVSSTANQHSPSHRFTFSQFMQLPTLTIVFANNVTLAIPPVHYMEGAISGVGASLDGATGWADGKNTRDLILRVYVDEPEGAVLGLNAQRDYDILYDSEDSGRIGFAKANCEKRMAKDKKTKTNRKPI